MSLSVCPAAVVAAPLEYVWKLLLEPALYDQWWDMHTERIVPEGEAAPGQVIYAKSGALGRQWNITFRVETVKSEKHQIQLHTTLPLGIIQDVTIACAAIDANSCRVQYG